MSSDNPTQSGTPAQASPASIAALRTVSETAVVTWVRSVYPVVDHCPPLCTFPSVTATQIFLPFPRAM